MSLNDIKNKVEHVYWWNNGIYYRRQLGSSFEWCWDGKAWILWRPLILAS